MFTTELTRVLTLVHNYIDGGFPASVITAMLALDNDSDLLDDAYEAWNEWGERDSDEFIDEVEFLTGECCCFCERCADIVWLEHSTTVGDEHICEPCLLKHYSRCYSCSTWVDDETLINVDGDSWCEGCAEDCSYCNECETYTRDCTTTVGHSEYCESCLERRCTYCDSCEEYFLDSDNHEHEDEGCDCDAPIRRFLIPANGQGTVTQNERLTVELPKGTIDDEGIKRIKQLLWNALDDQGYLAHGIVDEVGPLWQAKRGNFTRRLSAAFYQKHNIKLEPSVVSEVGNLARAHSSDGASWHVEFTRDLNRSASEFYHEDSCWWQSYFASRCCLKNWGGFGMLTYEDDDSPSYRPSGRIWVQPLDEDMEPTHDAVGAHAYVVYNGYGAPSGYIGARIMAHLTGKTYRQVSLSAGAQYINNDSAILIADEATCLETERVSYSYDSHDNRDAYYMKAAA